MPVRLLQRNGFWYAEKDRTRRSLKTKDKQVAEQLLAAIEKQDRIDIDRSLMASASGFKLTNKNITGIVYFIQAETGGYIKIGFTIDLEKRLKTVQAHSPVPVKIIGTMQGSIEIEQEIHSKFHKCRKHGEWFEPADCLLDFIKFYHEVITDNMRVPWEELIEAAGKGMTADISAITS